MPQHSHDRFATQNTNAVNPSRCTSLRIQLLTGCADLVIGCALSPHCDLQGCLLRVELRRIDSELSHSAHRTAERASDFRWVVILLLPCLSSRCGDGSVNKRSCHILGHHVAVICVQLHLAARDSCEDLSDALFRLSNGGGVFVTANI